MISIDLSQFVLHLGRQLNDTTKSLPKEIYHYFPKLERDLTKAGKTFERDPDMANMITSRNVLSHHYGELIAVGFKRWINETYEIGQSDEPCPSAEVLS